MTNQAPKTRPISNDRTLGSLFPTRFLKPAQLIAWKVTEIIVTISRIVEEQVQPKPNQVEWKTVLYFMAKNGHEHPQGYLLSAKIDSESLARSTRVELVGELPGKQIRIKLDEYRGKSVLRIDPEPIPTPIEPATETIEEHRRQREPEPEGFITDAGEAIGES